MNSAAGQDIAARQHLDYLTCVQRARLAELAGGNCAAAHQRKDDARATPVQIGASAVCRVSGDKV